MSSKSVVLLWRYCNFSIFKMAVAAILDFWGNREIFWLLGQRGSRRISMPNLVKIGQSVAKILRFFDFSRWRLPPSWIVKFTKFYWLSVSGGPIFIIIRNFVKIGCSVAETAIFRIFKLVAAAVLDLFGAYLDNQQWVFVGLYHSAKFGYDICSSFYNMNISIFGPFGWKMPLGFFGQFDPLNGLQYQPKPKRHIFAWDRVIWAIKRVNLASGLTCRCVS